MADEAQGELLPQGNGAVDPMQYLNKARMLAAERASLAVILLGDVVKNKEYDMDTRISAADCLLQFLARGTF